MRDTIRGFCLALLAIAALPAPAAAQSFAGGQFDPAIPTLTATVGHAPGARITSKLGNG